MEELLMAVDPTVCIPYWRSSEEQAFPSWLVGFTPTVNLISGPHTVTRNIGMFAFLPNAAAVAAAMSNGTFNMFAQALEGVNNSGHVWVGGSMGGILTAPADPIFWMHHAEIDRIWSEWQPANPGQNPTLVGAAAIMDPAGMRLTRELHWSGKFGKRQRGQRSRRAGLTPIGKAVCACPATCPTQVASISVEARARTMPFAPPGVEQGR
jgi:hypothetical protein